jgi:hypothetical protein
MITNFLLIDYLDNSFFLSIVARHDFGKPSAQGQGGNIEGTLLHTGKGIHQRKIALQSGGRC